MLEFILTNILMLALGAILYLAVRTLPRIEEETAGGENNMLDRLAYSEIPEKIDAFLNSVTEKLLRRVKVLLLRVDNYLSGHLKKIKTENGRTATPIDFKDITGQNKNGENKTPENGQNIDLRR